MTKPKPFPILQVPPLLAHSHELPVPILMFDEAMAVWFENLTDVPGLCGGMPLMLLS